MIIFYNERDNGAYVRLFANGAAVDMDVILKLEIQVAGQSFNTIDHPEVVRRDGDKYAITLGAAGIAPGTYGMEILAYSTDKPQGVVWGPPVKIIVRQMTGPTPTPAPVFLTQPSIAGTSQVGQLLTAVDGTASNTTTLTRKWYMDDAEIVGETGASYTLIAGDVGKVPGLRNFATGPGGGPVQSSLATAAAVIASGDGLPAYVGQVGSRSILPRQRLGTSKQFNSKAFHRLAQAVPSPIFDFPGFMGANAVTTPTGTGDLAVGSTMALRASVEYPPGTFTRLQFGGSDTGTVPDRGILSADPATNLFVGAADGVPFYLWVNGVIAGSGLPVIYSTIPADNNYSLLGEAYEHAVSGLTDKSGGGSITTAGGSPGLVYRAVGIRAQTTKRSFCVIGNSRQAGFSGILHDANGQQGTIPRAVTDSGRGVTVCSIGGDLASVWSTPANVSARATLMNNVSDVVVCIGINDIAAGDSAAAVQARITTIVNAAVAKGKRVGRATINPRTTSTDNWATATNQTPVAQESVRVAVNDWLRNSTNFPADSYLIDIADMVEVNAAGVLTRNGGRWPANGTPFFASPDGLHESLALNNSLSAGIRAAMGI